MDILETLDNLNKNRFKAIFVENENEALQYLKNNIPTKSQIGVGGSLTLKQLNILECLHQNGYIVNTPEYSEYDYPTLQMINRNVDYYLSGANAISQSGEIVNIDGTGNRVSSLIFGIKNVFIISGINKITPDLASAIERARNIAAPPNCVRLKRNTPCATTGKCSNCDSAECICNATVILHHPTSKTVTHIILVNKTLGY